MNTEAFAQTVVVPTHGETGGTDGSGGVKAGEPRAGYPEGTMLGRYVVVQEAGKGAMARVLRAYDPRLRREVALKVLLTAGTKEDRARITREARAMAQLNHPNVVNVYDVEEAVDPNGVTVVYVAMEYVAGQSARNWIKETRPWREVVAAFAQVGRALAAAHAAGLVHRDVKPANILVGDDARIRVTDFGLARPEGLGDAKRSEIDTRDDSSWDLELTRAGTVAGTPGYMAPEQHAGAAADPRSDQYAYCIALWQALYGSRPFNESTLVELVERKGRGPPAQPSASVPRRVHAVVARGLSPDPADRWPSMDDLLAALLVDPSRRRRRLAAVVVAAGGGAAAWGAYHIVELRQRDACVAKGAAIEEVWGQASRRRVEEAFASSESPLAVTAWTQARPWLDAYARRWAELRTQTCLGTEVERTRPPELDALAVACLDERRDGLASLVAVFAQADELAIRHAVGAAAALPSLDSCTNEASLRMLPPPPEGAEARAELASLRERLARAQSFLATGNLADALAETEDAIPDAERLGWEPIVARFILLRGSALEESGRFDEAAVAQEDAYVRAGAAGADVVAGRAATALIIIEGIRRARVQDGVRWARVAHMHLKRAGELDSIHESARLLNLGTVFTEDGRYDEAQRVRQRALEILEATVGVEHPRFGGALDGTANVLHAAGSFEEAIETYRRALELRERTLGPDHPLVGTSLNNLANLVEERGDHGRALKLYKRAAEIWRKAYPKDHPHIAIALNNVSNIHTALGETDRAEAELREAIGIWERALGPEHPNVMMGMTNLAGLMRSKGDVAAAIELQERALQIASRSRGRDHPDYGISLMMLGSMHRDAGQLDKAAQRFNEARANFEKSVGPDHSNMGFVLHGLGTVELARGDGEAGRRFLEAALVVRTSNATDPDLLAETRFALARALWDAKAEQTRALQLARKALEELKNQETRSKTGDELVAKLQKWLDQRPLPPGG